MSPTRPSSVRCSSAARGCAARGPGCRRSTRCCARRGRTSRETSSGQAVARGAGLALAAACLVAVMKTRPHEVARPAIAADVDRAASAVRDGAGGVCEEQEVSACSLRLRAREQAPMAPVAQESRACVAPPATFESFGTLSCDARRGQPDRDAADSLTRPRSGRAHGARAGWAAISAPARPRAATGEVHHAPRHRALAGSRFTSSGCSHAASDPSPAPVPAGRPRTPELPAGAPRREDVPRSRWTACPPSATRARSSPSSRSPTTSARTAAAPRRRSPSSAVVRQPVRLVVAEKPLPMHDRARPAAMAALAASSQGALRPDARADSSPARSTTARIALAARRPRARRRVASRPTAPGAALRRSARSEALAERLDVRGTPTFFINGRHVVGAQPIEEFRAVIDERLAAARALVAAGVRPEDVYARTIAGGADRVEEPSEGKGPGCGGDGECKRTARGATRPPSATTVENVPVDGAPSRGPARGPPSPSSSSRTTSARSARAPRPRSTPSSRRTPRRRALRLQEPAAAVPRSCAADGEGGHRRGRAGAILGDARPALRAGRHGGPRPPSSASPATWGSTSPGSTATSTTRRSTRASTRTTPTPKALGVTGTPTFFVNGRRIVGAQPAAVFEKAIAKR